MKLRTSPLCKSKPDKRNKVRKDPSRFFRKALVKRTKSLGPNVSKGFDQDSGSSSNSERSLSNKRKIHRSSKLRRKTERRSSRYRGIREKTRSRKHGYRDQQKHLRIRKSRDDEWKRGNDRNGRKMKLANIDGKGIGADDKLSKSGRRSRRLSRFQTRGKAKEKEKHDLFAMPDDNEKVEDVEYDDLTKMIDDDVLKGFSGYTDENNEKERDIVEGSRKENEEVREQTAEAKETKEIKENIQPETLIDRSGRLQDNPQETSPKNPDEKGEIRPPEEVERNEAKEKSEKVKIDEEEQWNEVGEEPKTARRQSEKTQDFGPSITEGKMKKYGEKSEHTNTENVC
ncbi:hypothetical protein AB6A40_007536 [Gnathostoma spinigerum]|uniref:Uncharacterized protein n=1 Tax=Gnathostoma spinigerum TaxID=75299 RepID=A0ABD6EW75_9BILA